MGRVAEMPPASASDGFQVARWVDAVGGFVSRRPRLWIALGNLETRLIADEIDATAVERPIFISGLARAGSTILLEILARHPDVVSHRYQDYPLVFTPFWWNRLLERMPKREAPPADGVFPAPAPGDVARRGPGRRHQPPGFRGVLPRAHPQARARARRPPLPVQGQLQRHPARVPAQTFPGRPLRHSGARSGVAHRVVDEAARAVLPGLQRPSRGTSSSASTAARSILATPRSSPASSMPGGAGTRSRVGRSTGPSSTAIWPIAWTPTPPCARPRWSYAMRTCAAPLRRCCGGPLLTAGSRRPPRGSRSSPPCSASRPITGPGSPRPSSGQSSATRRRPRSASATRRGPAADTRLGPRLAPLRPCSGSPEPTVADGAALARAS
jgi:hypothetical protein